MIWQYETKILCEQITGENWYYRCYACFVFAFHRIFGFQIVCLYCGCISQQHIIPYAMQMQMLNIDLSHFNCNWTAINTIEIWIGLAANNEFALEFLCVKWIIKFIHSNSNIKELTWNDCCCRNTIISTLFRTYSSIFEQVYYGIMYGMLQLTTIQWLNNNVNVCTLSFCKCLSPNHNKFIGSSRILFNDVVLNQWQLLQTIA